MPTCETQTDLQTLADIQSLIDYFSQMKTRLNLKKKKDIYDFESIKEDVLISRESLKEYLYKITKDLGQNRKVYYLQFPRGLFTREERYTLHKMSKKGQLLFSSNGPLDNRQITAQWTTELF
jgi:hypothetical protein